MRSYEFSKEQYRCLLVVLTELLVIELTGFKKGLRMIKARYILVCGEILFKMP